MLPLGLIALMCTRMCRNGLIIISLLRGQTGEKVRSNTAPECKEALIKYSCKLVTHLEVK